MLRCLVIAALVTLASGSASAQTVRLEQYRHPSEPKFETFNRIYLKGVLDGLIAYSVAHGRDRFFCMPPDLAMTVEQAEEIMLRYAERKQLPATAPVGIPLFGGLKEAFPCTKQ
jgi:hypothetical protein